LIEAEALNLCRVLHVPRFFTEAELAASALSGGTQSRVDFEAALAYAKERGWIRSAHVQPHLTLTSRGITALFQERSSDD
jgi:hypothetical protein